MTVDPEIPGSTDRQFRWRQPGITPTDKAVVSVQHVHPRRMRQEGGPRGGEPSRVTTLNPSRPAVSLPDSRSDPAAAAPVVSPGPASRRVGRSRGPVFVLGSPRSGTTLLYHMILSAGDFAVYRAESHVFTAIVPRFGNLRRAGARRAALQAWTRSHRFRIAEVDPVHFAARVERECRGGGDFLRIMMESVAEKQGVARWADCTPEHLLSARRIARELPDARFIHIVRDGRDVALSMMRQRWIRPLPGDDLSPLALAAIYWEWIVHQGQRRGAALGDRYREIRFEALLRDPAGTLRELGDFIDHDLDYERILAVGIGSVSRPNTSFAEQAGFNPTERWRSLPAVELAELELLIGDTLGALGYPLATDRRVRRGRRARLRLGRRMYRRLFSTKHWLKQHTPLGRVLTSLDILDG